MGKRKKLKATTHNDVAVANELMVAIDYEKLADCLAKAIAEESDKRINAYSITREWMKFIIAPVFWSISVLTAILAVGFFITTLNALNCWTGDLADIPNAIKGLVSFVLTLMSIFISIAAFFAGKEIDQEQDRQFVVSVFSGMVSLVALIVALVALVIIKQVGGRFLVAECVFKSEEAYFGSLGAYTAWAIKLPTLLAAAFCISLVVWV